MRIAFLGIIVLGMVLGFIVAVVIAMVFQAVGVEKLPSLLMLLIVFGVPTAFYYIVKDHRRHKRRRLALSQGLTLATETKGELRRRLAAFPILAALHKYMEGNRFRVHLDGVDILILDYLYVGFAIAEGTFILCSSCELNLPEFSICPWPMAYAKLAYGKLAGALVKDIPTPPEFSASYAILGRELDRIRSLVTPQVISHFLKYKDLNATGIGDTLVTHRGRRRVPDRRLMEAAKEAADLLALLKAASVSQAEHS